jgi:1-phosphofructokinase family hexose kinase
LKLTKVFAITPNPALDLGGQVADIVPNEKNYVEKETRFPGGNAINAARILTHLDRPVVASGFLGGGVGEGVKNLLRKEGVRSDFVAIEGETRINITVSNRATHKQTRLSFPGPAIRESEKRRLLLKVRKARPGTLLLIGGSFPPGFSVKDAKKIITLGHRKKIPAIVDVPAEHLKALLSSKPLMIKPNLHEFEAFVGKKLRDIPAIVLEAEKLLRYSPLVCISSVERGVLLVTRSGVYFASGPKVTAKSSVGAGDSLVGGVVAGILASSLSYDHFFPGRTHSNRRNSLEANLPGILKLGLGAALATITQTGTHLGSRRDIVKYSKQVKVRQLSK